MADDLWPANLTESNLVTPVAILREQAALLGDKTKNCDRRSADDDHRQSVCP